MDRTRLVILIVFLGFIVVPAMGGTKYMSGGPDMTAAISGANEFAPGQNATLKVNIENKGLIDIKFVQSGIVERDDLPNAAKLVKAALLPGNAPVTIKTDPQMVGDILGGDSVSVQFLAKIDTNAPPGEYILPLFLDYTYLREAEQYGQDSITYIYKYVNESIGIPVRIRPAAFLTVESMSAEHLNAGNEGYVVLRVRNSGFVDAESAVLKIARNGNSPVIPTDSSIYVGNFSMNSTIETRFKVSVSREASEQSYPLDIYLIYKDQAGDVQTTDIFTIGVPVKGKIGFSVTAQPEPMKAGEKRVIEVEYENTGEATAYGAQARISAVDPFTSNDDTAFLGDLEPGAKAVAKYEVSVANSATDKEYGLDSEIRYRDALDNSQISDTMKVRVMVQKPSSYLPIVAFIACMVVIGAAGYYLLVKKKKN
jgi:hypothetical protein